MIRLLFCLGLGMIVLPWPALWSFTAIWPEEGLETMSEGELYATETAALVILAMLVVAMGIVCTVIAALALAVRSSRGDLRRIREGRHGND